MINSAVISAALTVLVWAAPLQAWAADATTVASAHSAKFDAAFAACNVPAVMDLYEDHATAIFAEEEASGKAEIKKMVQRYCVNGRQQVPSYRQTSAHALMLAPHWIMMVRTLEGVDEKGKPFRINATELMQESGGQWRYVVDHASWGTAPKEPLHKLNLSA